MKARGIRIRDKKPREDKKTPGVILGDILKEIENGRDFNWSILFLDGMPNRENARSVIPLAKKINKSGNGLNVSWDDLNLLSFKYFQMYEIVVIGCRDSRLLKSYDTEKEMYESCDIVLDLIDCVYWDIFSKNSDFIDHLSKKFECIKFLTTDNFNTP